MAEAAELSETDRLAREHLSPFDAEVLLQLHPELAFQKPELAALRDSRDYYLEACSGLFKEAAKAIATEDPKKLAMLAQFAPRSDSTRTQWESAIEFAYKQALTVPSTTLLKWLDDYGVLFNIASLSEDVVRCPHRAVHIWIAKQLKTRKKKQKQQQQNQQPLALPPSEGTGGASA